MNAQQRWAQVEAEHLARFRSKFHVQRLEFETAQQRQQQKNETLLRTVAATSSRLMDLRSIYLSNPRGHRSRDTLIEAKTVLASLPKYVLDDDPRLTHTLKIVRAASAFGFDPAADKTLASVLDLVKRSAYAIDAQRSIQFLSALHMFQPRPEEDMRVIFENVADGIRRGSNELLVHEIATLLMTLHRLERDQPPSQRARVTARPLLDALTRHLVVYHTTAPVNDASRAVAFLSKVSPAHARVLLHEMQSRISKEAAALTLPPIAALDLLTALGHITSEAEETAVAAVSASNAVVFNRNFDLDDDLFAPPGLSLVSRPIAVRAMFAIASETLLTHAHLLAADDVADVFFAMRQNAALLHHPELVERLIARVLNIPAEEANSLTIVRVLEGINEMTMYHKANTKNAKTQRKQQQQQPEPKSSRAAGDGAELDTDEGATAAAQVFDHFAARLAHVASQHGNLSFGGSRLSLHQTVSILSTFADAGQDHHVELFTRLLLPLASGIPISNRNTVGDALLVRALRAIQKLNLHAAPVRGERTHSQQDTAIRAVAKIVTELFVVRGGLPEKATHLISETQAVVEAMLPEAERNDALLQAISPLIE